MFPTKLSKCFQPDGLYRRNGISTGDSPTDVAALGTIMPDYTLKHFKLCQRPDGSMVRHPDRINLPLDNELANYSRDHIISLCFATIYTKDSSILSKLLSYTLKNKGRFCRGPVGQSMVNVGVLAAMIGLSWHWIFRPLALFMYLLHILVLYYTVRNVEVGYRLILHVEHCLIARHLGIPWFILRPILKCAYEREECNLFYEWAYNRSIGLELSRESLNSLENKYNSLSSPFGTSWYWTQPSEAKRRPTGVDLMYLMELNKGEWFK